MTNPIYKITWFKSMAETRMPLRIVKTDLLDFFIVFEGVVRLYISNDGETAEKVLENIKDIIQSVLGGEYP